MQFSFLQQPQVRPAELLGDSLCTLSRNGNFRSFTSTFSLLTHERSEERVGTSIFDFFLARHHESLKLTLKAVRRGDSLNLLGVTCQLKSGETLRLDLSFVPRMYRKELNEILIFGKVSQTQDLPRAKTETPFETWPRLEPFGEDLTKYLEQLLAQAPIGLCFFDRDLRYASVNHFLAEVNGCSPEQHLGHTLAEQLPEAAPLIDPILKSVMQTGIPVANVEVPVRTNGTIRTMLQSFYPVRGPEGECLGVAATAIDVSEERLNEEKLRAVASELARSNEDLQRFAYIASHDLQEPLRMVTNYIALLEQKHKPSLDSDSHKYMEFVLDGATRMRALIRDLLEYAEVSAGHRSLQLIDFKPVIQECMQDMQEQIREEHAEITIDPLPQIWGDPIQMGQLFCNLIGNAVKYHGKAPPKIRVSAQRSNDEWVFSVRDNGIGFEMKYASKIFEPFRRLHARAEFAGTGIGLAICRKIVEGHKGRIWVQSEPGVGTTFYFTLPDSNDPTSPAST